jgi:hypothetical protein
MTDIVPATSQEKTGSGSIKPCPEDVIDVDEEDIIDDEQVDEFKEQLEALGSFPVCVFGLFREPQKFLSSSSHSCFGCSITQLLSSFKHTGQSNDQYFIDDRRGL